MRLRLAHGDPHLQETIARRLRGSNVGRLFGFALESIEPGRVVLRLRVRAKHIQLQGVVHGGVLAALADSAAGMAVHLAAPPGCRVATIEFKINYLVPLVDGVVYADARVLRVGATTAVVECDTRDAHGRLVTKALLTFSVKRGGKKKR